MAPFEPGANCYCLCLDHRVAETLEVGALGDLNWPGGWTYYVGRASRGWSSRLKRFTTEHVNFWHIDYLVSAPHSRLAAVLPVNWAAKRECELARKFENISFLSSLPESFGASDCEQNCSAHAWVGELAPEELFNRLVSDGVAATGWLEFRPTKCEWKLFPV